MTFDFFSSELGVAVAWIATILSALLAVWSIALFFGERGRSRGLDAVLKRYGVTEQLAADEQELTKKKQDAQKSAEALQHEVEALRTDIRDSLPQRARAAFFESAIPEIERQIVELNKRRQDMVRELRRADPQSRLDDSPIGDIEDEIQKKWLARRDLDEQQILLSIVVGASAALAQFYPLSLAAGLFSAPILVRMAMLWAEVYPTSPMAKVFASRAFKAAPLLFATLIFVLLVSLAIVFAVGWMRW